MSVHNESADTRSDKDYSARLAFTDRVYASVYEQIVTWLAVPPGSRVLDVGCGTGSMTVLLARMVGQNGTVAALDIAPAHLNATQHLLDTTPYAQRVEYHQGDIDALPFEAAQFDLVWCSHVVHGQPDQLASTRGLCRMVKPGGRVALREGGLPLQCLPSELGIGTPGLEARLRAAFEQWFAGWRALLPGSVSYPWGWSQMLRTAGCGSVTAHTFLLEALSPLNDDHQLYIKEWLEGMLEDGAQTLTEGDQQTVAQLLDPASPHYVLQRPDLHLRAGTSVYVGTLNA